MRESARSAPHARNVTCTLLAASLLGVIAWPASAQPYSEWVHYDPIEVASPWGPQRVLVTLPRRSDHARHPPGERYPIVVALHGRSEAADPERAYLSWANRYSLASGFGAVMRQRLVVSDYNRFVRTHHLDYVNGALTRRHFQGVMVVTPYMPDFATEPVGSASVDEYGDWLATELLRTVRQRFDGAALTRDGTGIDGISLGGRIALETGFSHPEVFGAVSGMQPAVRQDGGQLAELALAAAREHRQHVRLLSSDDDPFLPGTQRMSAQLDERHVTHTLTVVPGPHGYEFNRGPAVVEMLLFHDRALRHEPL